MILRREVQKIRSGKWEELEEVYRNYKSPFRALGQAIGGRFGLCAGGCAAFGDLFLRCGRPGRLKFIPLPHVQHDAFGKHRAGVGARVVIVELTRRPVRDL